MRTNVRQQLYKSIKEALVTLAREAVDARNQHLNQAMDLYMKHQYLPDDVQEKRGRQMHKLYLQLLEHRLHSEREYQLRHQLQPCLQVLFHYPILQEEPRSVEIQ
ncbi:hypothetical protein PVAP13_2KG305202 [Panicum virgatum]|uniref:Uncharacterized protein n=1 Tax=Panicum virgatum TaxID=38727 RepID=A0A8T0WC35_PANVG|nr:hypothetical protein PVAP13_2KG305202 [Panicum virgatum]